MVREVRVSSDLAGRSIPEGAYSPGFSDEAEQTRGRWVYVDRVNLIEAYDQPWKRFFEGTVGGHWGIFDDATREPKFTYGTPVSNHPLWRWQAAGGVAFAALVFGAALFGMRDAKDEPGIGAWIAVAVNAASGGVLIGLTIEHLPVESLGVAGWMRTVAFALLAVAAPLAGAAALTARIANPSFVHSIGAKEERAKEWLPITLGLLFAASFVMAMLTALGFAFDPRYRDFPFAPLTAIAVPFLLVAFAVLIASNDNYQAVAFTAAFFSLVSIILTFFWLPETRNPEQQTRAHHAIALQRNPWKNQ